MRIILIDTFTSRGIDIKTLWLLDDMRFPVGKITRFNFSSMSTPYGRRFEHIGICVGTTSGHGSSSVADVLAKNDNDASSSSSSPVLASFTDDNATTQQVSVKTMLICVGMASLLGVVFGVVGMHVVRKQMHQKDRRSPPLEMLSNASRHQLSEKRAKRSMTTTTSLMWVKTDDDEEKDDNHNDDIESSRFMGKESKDESQCRLLASSPLSSSSLSSSPSTLSNLSPRIHMRKYK